MDAAASSSSSEIPFTKIRTDLSRVFQYYLDRSTPHPGGRWLGTAGVAAVYVFRCYLLQGFYIVSYGLGIYVLNLLIGFLSPIVDPEIEALDGAALPTRGSDEFKPFIRGLPEFRFWFLLGGRRSDTSLMSLGKQSITGVRFTVPPLDFEAEQSPSCLLAGSADCRSLLPGRTAGPLLCCREKSNIIYSCMFKIVTSKKKKVWNVYGVLNYLQALVEKSTIIQILEREKEGLEQFTATDGYDYEGGSNVLKMLGYYNMIGLLRVHRLLGDYHTGLKYLAPIDISQQGVYTIIIGSHIATVYHYGFANLMFRRVCLYNEVDQVRQRLQLWSHLVGVANRKASSR